MVLLRNSARDTKKGDKLVQCWLGQYKIVENIGKGQYVLRNTTSGKTLKMHSIDASRVFQDR